MDVVDIGYPDPLARREWVIGRCLKWHRSLTRDKMEQKFSAFQERLTEFLLDQKYAPPVSLKWYEWKCDFGIFEELRPAKVDEAFPWRQYRPEPFSKENEMGSYTKLFKSKYPELAESQGGKTGADAVAEALSSLTLRERGKGSAGEPSGKVAWKPQDMQGGWVTPRQVRLDAWNMVCPGMKFQLGVGPLEVLFPELEGVSFDECFVKDQEKIRGLQDNVVRISWVNTEGRKLIVVGFYKNWDTKMTTSCHGAMRLVQVFSAVLDWCAELVRTGKNYPLSAALKKREGVHVKFTRKGHIESADGFDTVIDDQKDALAAAATKRVATRQQMDKVRELADTWISKLWNHDLERRTTAIRSWCDVTQLEQETLSLAEVRCAAREAWLAQIEQRKSSMTQDLVANEVAAATSSTSIWGLVPPGGKQASVAASQGSRPVASGSGLQTLGKKAAPVKDTGKAKDSGQPASPGKKPAPAKDTGKGKGKGKGFAPSPSLGEKPAPVKDTGKGKEPVASGSGSAASLGKKAPLAEDTSKGKGGLLSIPEDLTKIFGDDDEDEDAMSLLQAFKMTNKRGGSQGKQ